MQTDVSGSAANPLREAMLQVFPGRKDIADMKFDGANVPAWGVYARLASLDTQALAAALAPAFGIEASGPIDGLRIPSDVLSQIPSALCQQRNILPLRWQDGRLVVATARPSDQDLAERVAFIVGKPITWVLAPPEALEDAVVIAYSNEAARAAKTVIDDAGGAGQWDENAIVKLGRGLMEKALEQRASDLHIQPYLGAAVVRIRVDGVMRRLTMLPEAVATMLIRHIKARGGMDSSQSQIPLDGRMSIVVNGHDYELRLSTLPAARGERLVMRFLPQSQIKRLGSAGFSLAALQTLRRAAARPAGLIIFTGPTGSGKTSTLYGMLAEINRSDINIITVENPVEYRIPGISQVEVNEKAGRTFGTALRSILRQDPDVILIGEIRDEETAEIAAQAAMTGHLVLTTLHTIDALTAVPRLFNLGVQPSVLADALVVVVAQRLCRILCSTCKAPVVDAQTPEERLFQEITHNLPAYRTVGCEHCNFTGFKGRLPIVDIVETNKKLRDAVAAGEAQLTVLEGLREGGLKSLAASGSLRVISGDTTVREVLLAVGPGFWSELAQHYGTYFSSENAESIPMNAARGFGILFISEDAGLADQFRPAMEAEGFRLIQVNGAQEAERTLHADEDIAFILGDVPEGRGIDEVSDAMRSYRQHVAWARLPTAVLLPAALATEEKHLRDAGMMAAVFSKPVGVEAVLEQIRRSQAR